MRRSSQIKLSDKWVYVVLALAILFFILVVIWLITVKFPIDYANGTAINSTVAQNNAKTMIQAQTVPTIVNGIATSASIIVAFSGALIALFYREVFREDEKGKQVLIVFSTLFAGTFGFLFLAYFTLANGGQYFLENAWRFAMFGFSIALFLILCIFLFVAPHVDKLPKTEQQKPQTDGKADWQIIIKNGDKTLEATGMDGATVQKILESWHVNINPANPENPKTNDAKT